MTKKNFTYGMDSLIQNSKRNIKTDEVKDHQATKQSKVKATYYYNNMDLESIKAISFYERRSIGDVIEEALKNYLELYPNLDAAKHIYTSKA
ncbi:hypothetical protein [Saccharicrinis aurantiacus]|uniref:hypothetical protein n=1 Tax=Saccharicrinis aurantiacus TaxID=1849719 RepID=UPI002490BCDB|nr:hypothetical protein [Saccharicrinis aurantiacus]